MKILAIMYIMLYSIEILCIPFLFAEKRHEYSPRKLLGMLALRLPLIWMLYYVATNL